ncbi:MAG: DUF2088 domain-containing protein [Phycisphaerae bacterium]|nr:DUF2088 domain-containing protein [Phycisphaerae bacterium]
MWFYEEGKALDKSVQKDMMVRLLKEAAQRITPDIKKVLILPPDLTRFHSDAGVLTNDLYHLLGSDCHVDVIPTLGQHVPHTPEENQWMFGDIPNDRIHAHDWKTSCKKLGEVSAEFVSYATDGQVNWNIPVEINRAIFDGGYDLIINVGQVVPHEVLGFANHNKNYFIGLGSKAMISNSHMMAGTYGIENNLGQLITPLRGCFNVAERDYLGDVPHVYVQIVKTQDDDGKLITSGLYVGEGVDTYIAAARHAREKTIHLFDKPMNKIICHMDAREFKSTWVGNKAVYRTRMAVADGGELIILAPGVERFGEQPEVDRMIRKYGYKGTANTLEAYNSDAELADLGLAAAHLLHGSSEGRFKITYAPGKLKKEEVESVGFSYMDLDEAMAKYNPEKMKDGINQIDGEEVYFINSPSLGLWAAKDKYLAAIKKNLDFAKKMVAKEPEEKIWKLLEEIDIEDIERFA